MKYTLRRNIYSQNPEEGLVSHVVYKEITVQAPLAEGMEIDDEAWHRKDVTKIENIFVGIDGNDGVHIAEIEGRQLKNKEEVKSLVETVLHHEGWQCDTL